MWRNSQETEALVIFTEEILNGKLIFLYSAVLEAAYPLSWQYLLKNRWQWCHQQLQGSVSLMDPALVQVVNLLPKHGDPSFVRGGDFTL